MQNEMNEQKQITEITIGDKKYLIADLTQRVCDTINHRNESTRSQLQLSVALRKESAWLQSLDVDLKTMMEEDKIKPMLEEAVVEEANPNPEVFN
jgi:hypothetical protein